MVNTILNKITLMTLRDREQDYKTTWLSTISLIKTKHLTICAMIDLIFEIKPLPLSLIDENEKVKKNESIEE